MTPYYEHNGITIFHGDCRDVLPSLDSVDLVLTDPPYGENFDTDYTRFTGGVSASCGTHATIHNDNHSFDPRHLLGIGSQQIIFGCNRFSNKLPVGSLLIWDKRTPYGSKNVMSDGEPAWWSKGRGVYIFSHMWDGFNRASERKTNYHPTQKPVALALWCLSMAKPTGLVLDPYCGSGFVGVACKKAGLSCVLIDTDERYCEIAALRLSQEVLQFPEAV